MGRIVQRHVAATEVASGKLAEVLKEDYRRLGVENNNVGGSVADLAKDVIVTMPLLMLREFTYFVSVGCVLHILQLIMMVAIFAAFGQQVKGSDKKVAGEKGAFRIGFITHYLFSLESD